VYAWAEDDAVWIEGEDEGTGFDPDDDAPFRGSVGLDNVCGRIEMIGGTVSLESEPGAGTRGLIVIPHSVAQTGNES